MTPDVFAYLDYRRFLRDFYIEKKSKGAGFSYRNFSRRAGISAPNYLKLVIDGQRNLSQDMAGKFAGACGLEKRAAQYFVDLVAFNQATPGEERESAYRRLTSNKTYREARTLDVHHASYHSEWYIPAIRELAHHDDFRADPEWIACRMWPPIKAQEAQKALDVLMALGMLVPTEGEHGEKSVRLGEALVTTGPELQRFHIAQYHRMMMRQASDAIDQVPPHDRDISSLTLCLTPGSIARMKERIQRFRQELLELSALEEHPSQVVQLNMQLFPLSIAEPNTVETNHSETNTAETNTADPGMTEPSAAAPINEPSASTHGEHAENAPASRTRKTAATTKAKALRAAPSKRKA